MAEERNGINAPLAGVQQELISAHFLLLRRILVKSARAAFSGLQPENRMEQRVVFTLYRMEEARVSELASMLGNDVAQVSRALASLRKDGLAQRERQRDPYTLTPKGVVLGQELDAVAKRREEELLRGLSPVEIFELAGLMIKLQSRAAQILADEMALAKSEEPGEEGPGTLTDTPNRVQAAIINIANIITRSATASFKRQTGVSNFEWRVLVNAASRPSISFMGLVEHVDADKAQVSRTLDSLASAGLVNRVKDATSGQVKIELTEEGQRVYGVMRDDALRRNVIFAGWLKPAQRGRLQGYLDLLIRNTLEMEGVEDRAPPE
ncbi:MarR family transcriptional regulator [Altererythrobacter sp. CC-YST694]|uniref:MarR family winged helix-turn-helix transcriptional regulator n=1 Tax=Altererythrobacter sp. CC-YST694 TaxID=2755038 RepID=UPI001D030114|nr:MarR family transcriptional regulator [Altererythrobacter sp. CC-YST694]MCB5426482.1 MarR family transcriptional regulator [Altererythrobacter sp. CC-YST694]